jgi:hypothetical protein
LDFFYDISPFICKSSTHSPLQNPHPRRLRGMKRMAALARDLLGKTETLPFDFTKSHLPMILNARPSPEL